MYTLIYVYVILQLATEDESHGELIYLPNLKEVASVTTTEELRKKVDAAEKAARDLLSEEADLAKKVEKRRAKASKKNAKKSAR